jgi:hypothetical protein
MLGQYTSEQVHHIIADNTGAPYQDLWEVFCDDCKRLDISKPILQGIQELRKAWHCILCTDNMDSFDRFTLPANPHLTEAFDEVHCSYSRQQLKKSDAGQYFLTTTINLGLQMDSSVLIDDSNANCTLFEDIGGLAFHTQEEQEVIAVLEKLQ